MRTCMYEVNLQYGWQRRLMHPSQPYLPLLSSQCSSRSIKCIQCSCLHVLIVWNLISLCFWYVLLHRWVTTIASSILSTCLVIGATGSHQSWDDLVKVPLAIWLCSISGTAWWEFSIGSIVWWGCSTEWIWVRFCLCGVRLNGDFASVLVENWAMMKSHDDADPKECPDVNVHHLI